MHDSIPNSEKAKLKHSTELGNIKLRLEFTGSGREYFRIWIVNLLLTLITLGLYYPWATVRRLRYFYSNTHLDGDPLNFHGDPRKMAKGYLLMAALLALILLATYFSLLAGFAAFLIVVGLEPSLLRSSLQFRLANTSWRDLRFRFNGSLRDAYAATVPMFLPAVALLGLVMLNPTPNPTPPWVGMACGIIILGAVALLPWLFWKQKKHRHTHYALGSMQTQFKATPANFYRLFFNVIGFTVLIALLPMASISFLVYGIPLKGSDASSTGAALRMSGAALNIAIGMVAVLVAIKPYAVSRLQNLVWTQTGNRSLRFISKLRFRGLLWLTIKNWLLIIITLGLYWPFAAIEIARMRIEAICVKTRMDPNTLVGTTRAVEGDAAEDTTGDFFGFDIGL